jgi:hypothetical protein
MEIPEHFFQTIYSYLAQRQKDEFRGDDILVKVLRTLKILYLFIRNQPLTPNSYLVLTSREDKAEVKFTSGECQDITENFNINLWFQRELGEEKSTGRETIFSVLNSKDQGYILRYDRQSKQLEYVVMEEASQAVHPLCPVNSHYWNYITMFQSYGKCTLY